MQILNWTRKSPLREEIAFVVSALLRVILIYGNTSKDILPTNAISQ